MELRERTTQEVIEDHLRLRSMGKLEQDLSRNYSTAIVVLSYEGISRGHDGVRRLARILHTYLPDGRYTYDHVAVAGRFGYLEWSGSDADRTVHDGADSFAVEDGLIVAQTIHFSSRGSPRS